MPERLFSTYQVADLLGATPGAVVEWIQKGWLPVQRLPDGPLRISEKGLVQFLKSRGINLEQIMARVTARQSGRGEPRTVEKDLPRLDPSQHPSEPPQAPSHLRAVRSETVEKMFPLEVGIAQQAPSRSAPAATQPRPPSPERVRAEAPAAQTAAIKQAEPWLTTEDKEPTVEDRLEESAHEAVEVEEAPAASEPAESLESAEKEALLGEAEPTPPQEPPVREEVEVATKEEEEKPPALRGDAITTVPEKPPTSQGEETAVAAEAQHVAAPVASADSTVAAALTLIRGALSHRTSEVHMEQTASGLSVRLRIDGLLHEAARCDVRPPAQGWAAAVQQLRDLVGTERADPRRPSRGQADLLLDDREVAITVATCPTSLGQRMVVSLRDSQAEPLSLSLLGLPDETQRHLARLVSGPSGLVLLAARSGKERTQALQAILSSLDASARSIAMIASRPTAIVPGLTPILADPAADFALPQAVKTAAEQDADVILLPDLRDSQAYPAMLEAAEGGRLIVAATSATSVLEVVTSLLEMELEPLSLSEALKAVIAYAPVRRLCPDCRQAGQPSDEAMDRLGLTADQVDEAFTAVGCPRCYGIGYLGTIGCSSAMLVDKTLAAVLRNGPAPAELAEVAERAGTRPLLQVGLELVREGITSLEELARALPPPP